MCPLRRHGQSDGSIVVLSWQRLEIQAQEKEMFSHCAWPTHKSYTWKTENMYIFWKISLQTGSCNYLVPSRHIGEAAVFRGEIYTIGSFGAWEGETLQQWHHEEENLHPCEGLSNTSPLSWEIKTNKISENLNFMPEISGTMIVGTVFLNWSHEHIIEKSSTVNTKMSLTSRSEDSATFSE